MTNDTLASFLMKRHKNKHSVFFFYFLVPVWFACFWAIVGTAWRPLWASVALIAFFLVLVGTVDWVTRRWTTIKWQFGMKPTKEQNESEEESVLQQMTRSKTAEGLERLDGTFLAEFAAESQTATVHIPFCPAFDRVPKVQVFTADKTEAHLRITSAKPFGIRVDVKRKNWIADKIRFAVIAEG